MREHIELRVFRSLVVHSNDDIYRNALVDRSFYRHLSDGEKRFRVQSYSDSRSFARTYLLTSFLKKWSGWDTSAKDTREYTQDLWYKTEGHVYAVNQRLRNMDNVNLTPEIPAARLIVEARRKIVRMIGSSPPQSWLTRCDWPTGATLDTRMGSLVGDKVCKCSITTTSSAYPYAAYLLGDFSHVNVRSNRQEVVPKTYKVHRVIACEPTVNAMLQKGVGRTLRHLLKQRCGIDIATQSDQNRDLSYLAYSCGLSTIDLESASDTIASALVHLLFPPQWYELLHDLRSPTTFTADGRRVYLEKFASMGNGYIFELETILFRAVVEAAYTLCGVQDDSSIAVFGDDIIVKREMYDTVCQCLVFCGFIVNKEKSFKEGDFFESCGKHYWREHDVTPAFQKKVVGKSAFELIAMHNRLFRWAQRTGNFAMVNEALRLIKDEFRSLYTKYRDIPRQPTFTVGDVGFLSRSGFKFNKHGDIILSLALIRRRPEKQLDRHHEFYLSNSLRCGNSFYTDRLGQLTEPISDGFYTLRRDFKMWRSGSCIE